MEPCIRKSKFLKNFLIIKRLRTGSLWQCIIFYNFKKMHRSHRKVFECRLSSHIHKHTHVISNPGIELWEVARKVKDGSPMPDWWGQLSWLIMYKYYVNNLSCTLLQTNQEVATGLMDTGASGHCIRPQDPHKNATRDRPHNSSLPTW